MCILHHGSLSVESQGKTLHSIVTSTTNTCEVFFHPFLLLEVPICCRYFNCYNGVLIKIWRPVATIKPFASLSQLRAVRLFCSLEVWKSLLIQWDPYRELLASTCFLLSFSNLCCPKGYVYVIEKSEGLSGTMKFCQLLY